MGNYRQCTSLLPLKKREIILDMQFKIIPFPFFAFLIINIGIPTPVFDFFASAHKRDSLHYICFKKQIGENFRINISCEMNSED